MLVNVGKTKNPYFAPDQIVGFNRAYLSWRAVQAYHRATGVAVQRPGHAIAATRRRNSTRPNRTRTSLPIRRRVTPPHASRLSPLERPDILRVEGLHGLFPSCLHLDRCGRVDRGLPQFGARRCFHHATWRWRSLRTRRHGLPRRSDLQRDRHMCGDRHDGAWRPLHAHRRVRSGVLLQQPWRVLRCGRQSGGASGVRTPEACVARAPRAPAQRPGSTARASSRPVSTPSAPTAGCFHPSILTAVAEPIPRATWDKPCLSAFDCLAGLACEPSSHSCQAAVPGVGLPTLWTGASCEFPDEENLTSPPCGRTSRSRPRRGRRDTISSACRIERHPSRPAVSAAQPAARRLRAT